jgi:hypothetical protein
MPDRQDPKIDVDISPQSGPGALIVSLVALVFSGISLYETLLKQPHIVLSTAGTWLYARGESAAAEELQIPLTLTNSGARDATVMSIELSLRKGNEDKIFQSVYISNGAPDNRSLLTPIPLSGRSAFSGLLIFTPPKAGAPIVNGEGDYRATINIRSTFVRAYGWLDGWTSNPTQPASFTLELGDFPVAEVIGRRKPIPMAAREDGAKTIGEK